MEETSSSRGKNGNLIEIHVRKGSVARVRFEREGEEAVARPVDMFRISWRLLIVAAQWGATRPAGSLAYIWMERLDARGNEFGKVRRKAKALTITSL